MYTTDDYYAYDGGYSPASEAAQDDVDWLSDEFDRFLKLIGCQRTYDSEWYYNCQHSGIHAVTCCSTCVYEPVEVDGFGYDEYLRIYNDAYPRMRAMYDWLERVDNHLNEAPLTGMWHYARRRDERLDDRRTVVLAAYEDFVDDLLESLCDSYERLLEEACDYAYSDKAAERWVELMNEEAA